MATLLYDIEYTLVLFPLFAIFLFIYHYKATGKFSFPFFTYLLVAMFYEILFLYDFEKYINVISFLHITSQLFFLWLLKPVIKINIKNFSTHNVTELIIGFLGMSYVIGYVLYLIFPLVPDLTLFIPSVISFLLIIVACIGIPLFNKHPDNIMLWGIGGGLIAEMVCAFTYQYVSDHRAYLVMAHIFGAFLKIIFALYLTRIDAIKDFDVEDEDYL
ncbi:hypothetical protein [uncultured Dokdonia sp.]|uniref:hypothetical protein n=1 Tax=uncultured Dokdonia sp. TaxID=575653 RepID=UPI00260AF6DC|nr:hypothetical protein [uncultured Dokdonia sp.]